MLLAAVALVAVSCGDDGATSDPEADRVTSAAALLTVDDLGPGWTSAPAEDSDNSLDAILSELAGTAPECASVVELDVDMGDGIDLGPDAPAMAESPELSSGDFDQVEHIVSMWADDDDAADTFRTAQDAELATCLQAIYPQALTRAVAEDESLAGLTYSNIVVRERPVTVGDEGFGIEITVDISAGANSLTALFVLVVARVGRLTSALNVTTTAQDPLDADALLAQAVVKAESVLAAEG